MSRIFLGLSITMIALSAAPLPHSVVSSGASNSAQPDTVVLRVEGMICGGCEMSIESVVSKLSGVLAVKANHETGEVRVAVDGKNAPSLADLGNAVTQAGYTPKPPHHERPPLSGHWSAVVHRDGEDHRIDVDLDLLESRWVGEFDLPSFGLENYPIEVTLSDTDVALHFSAVSVDFRGRFSPDADSLIGIARRENEEPFEIKLERTGEATFSEMFLALEKAAEDRTAVRILSGLEELKAAFNRDTAKVRLLMLLAPS